MTRSIRLLLKTLPLWLAVATPAFAAPSPAPRATAVPARPAPLGPGARVTDVPNGFSIVPPASWTRSGPTSQAFMVFLDQLRNNFRANFIVNLSPDDGVAFDNMKEQLKQMQAREYPKWQLQGEGMTTVGGQQAYWLSCRFSLQGYDIQNLQYYIRGRNRKFYVLIFTVPVAGFQAYEPMFRQIAASVQFL